MKKTIQRLSFLLVLALSILVSSCDSWMSGDNFFDTIADEVKYANAPVISVFVRYPNRNMGETSPNGTSKQKVDIPFTVTAVDSNNYGFYKWAAFTTTDFKTIQQYNDILYTTTENEYEQKYGDLELGEDEVVFEDPRNPVTTVRILNERNDVFIMPICVRRPYIKISLPTNNQTGVVKNSSIVLSFSSLMNRDDLIREYEPGKYTYNEDFIAIQPYVSTFTEVRYFDIKDSLKRGGVQYLMNAKIDESNGNSVLKISLPTAPAGQEPFYLPQGTVLVSVSSTIKDSLGYEIGNDGASLNFIVVNELDSEKPKILDLEVGTTDLVRNTSNDIELPRVGETVNIRAYIGDKSKPEDVNFTDNVSLINYSLQRIQDPSSTLVKTGSALDSIDSSLGYAGMANFTESPRANLTSEQTMGTTFSIPLETYSDGLWKLTLWGTDNVGNEGDHSSPELSTGESSSTPPESKVIYFIKDTLSPNAEECKLGVTAQSDEAPYGWYNTSTLSNIEIKESALDVIKDNPSVACKPFRSPRLWWALYVGADFENWSNSMTVDSSAWQQIPATPDPRALNDLLGTPINPSTIAEGTVNVYAMFKDDVGNISNRVNLDAVKYDGTKPVTGALGWITPAGVPEGFTSGNVLGDGTLLAVPFTETLSGIKKIAIEVESSNGTTYKSAFSDNNFNVKVLQSDGTYSSPVGITKETNSGTGALDLLFNTPIKSTDFNTLYLENLKISASTLVDGNYRIKVKLYDAALNVADERDIIISVDTVAPVIQQVLVENVKKFIPVSDTTATPKFYISSSAYDENVEANKVTLDIKVLEETSGLYTLTLGNNAALTSASIVTLKNSSTGAVIVAPNVVDPATNTVTFTQKCTAMCAVPISIQITNVSLGATDGDKTISVVTKDYAIQPSNTMSNLKFEGESGTYTKVWMDPSNKACTEPSYFTVKGVETNLDGYTKTVNLNADLRFQTIAESGLKKIRLTGVKAKTGTQITYNSNVLDYTLEDNGTTIVFAYSIMGTNPILTITNLELTSLTQGVNTLSASYEYLAGWLSPAKETTVIYDTVAPVVNNDLLWIPQSTSYSMGGATKYIKISDQYFVIPVAEVNSGVKKIEIKVEKPGANGEFVSNPCTGLDYVGYGDVGNSDSGASTLSSAEWSSSGDVITITHPETYGKAGYYYIRGISLGANASSVAEGDYILHVTLYDTAGNISLEKTGLINYDVTVPVVLNSYFEGVVNTALSPARTYTTHSADNTLFIQMTETGSGVKVINLTHPFGYDPYNTAAAFCRNVVPTENTKLYKQKDDGSFEEVPCTVDTSARTLTVANGSEIKGSSMLLKVTALSLLDTTVKTYAASVGIKLKDLATNANSITSTNTVGPTLAAVVEDNGPATIMSNYGGLYDTGRVISEGNLVADSSSITPDTGFTNSPVVNLSCRLNEFAYDAEMTSSSGLRVIKLEGASFIPDSAKNGTKGTYINWVEYCHSSGRHANFNAITPSGNRDGESTFKTQYYIESKDSIAACGFGFTDDDLGFYLVGNDTLVFRTPLNVWDNYYFYLVNIKLNDTESAGEKNVTIKVFDTASQLATTCPNGSTATYSIKYSAAKPTIQVRTGTTTNPAEIDAAHIETLVPVNNGLRTYVQAAAVAGNPDIARVYSWDDKAFRNGERKDPEGDGVYSGSSKRQYFDLDVSTGTVANAYRYAWTVSDSATDTTIPTSGWVSTSSSKVDVKIPDVLPLSSSTAKYLYLHVADQAGNVTTARMSDCKWLNASNHGSSEWPWRSSDSGRDTYEMEDGVYYLEEYGYTNGSSGDPKYHVVLPANSSGTKKIYFPPEWFTLTTSNGVPIYGCAMGGATSGGTGHTDCSLAKHDEHGAYLELEESFYNGSSPSAYFYVYDAVGIDMTAYIVVEKDSTPPWFEISVAPGQNDKHMKWKEDNSVLSPSGSVGNTVDPSNRIYVQRYYTPSTSSSEIGTIMVNGGVASYNTTGLTQGLTEGNPFVIYTDSDNINVLLLSKKAEGDTIKYKYSIDDVTTEYSDYSDTHTEWSQSSNYYGKDISHLTINASQIIKLTAVDKGYNTSDIYLKVEKDTTGPTITATEVQKVNQFRETVSGSSVKTNYFGANATASVTVSDALSGLKTVNLKDGSSLPVNGSSLTIYEKVFSTTLSSLYDSTAHTLTLDATDNFNNPASSSLEYNGCSRWVEDTSAPGTPALNYVSPANNANTIKSDYYKSGQDGLYVSNSSSTWTVKFSNKVSKITIKPSATDNSGGSGVMGFVLVDSTSPLKNFYLRSEVFKTSEDISVADQTEETTKYLYAVDKAGNPSSTPLTIVLRPNNIKPVCQSISGSGIYSYGTNGWFSSTASLTVSVTQSPDLYWIGWDVDDSDETHHWTVGNYATTISIPSDANGGNLLALSFAKEGSFGQYYLLEAPNGTVAMTASDTLASNGVTSWTLDSTPPTNITVTDVDVSVSDTNGKAHKASDGKIYYNDYASSLTLTLSASDVGSGVKGYASNTTDTPTQTVDVSLSGSPTSVTIYAYDNVGNRSSQAFALVKDVTPPFVDFDHAAMSNCTKIGDTFYYSNPATATITLPITDAGSGLDESSLQNNVQITLQDYFVSGVGIKIPKGTIFDNVGNSDDYIISNVVPDTTAPSAATSLTGVSSSSGTTILDGSTVFYKAADANTKLTLTLSGMSDPTPGSGVAGFTVTSSGVSLVTSTENTIVIEPTGLSFPSSVTIHSKDGVGNVSSAGFIVTLTKDSAPPEVTFACTPENGKIYYKADNSSYYYKGSTTSASVTVEDTGSGLHSDSMTSGNIKLDDYVPTGTHKITIDSGRVKDKLGNTQTYESDFLVYKDETAPSLLSTNFTITGSPFVGDFSASSTEQTSWYKSSFKVAIKDSCETGGAGLAYWQIGTSTSKQTSGTYVSSTTAEDLSLPTSITSPTTLYVYAEDNLGNSDYCLLSSLVAGAAEKWCYNNGTAPSAPALSAISSVKATVGESSSTDYAHLDSANSTIFYNGTATALTIAMTKPTSIKGYNTSGNIGDTPSPTISVTPSATSVTIYAFDYKGNKSATGLSLTLTGDSAPPSVEATYSDGAGGKVYTKDGKIYFKGTPTVTLTAVDYTGGVGLDTSSLSTITLSSTSSYYIAADNVLRIPSGEIKDLVGNTQVYNLNLGNLIYDGTAPSLTGTNFTASGDIYVGTESASSTTKVVWYKSGAKIHISGSESGGSGLAYWQIGTSSDKGLGTYVDSTGEGADNAITLPNTITSATKLYIYAEDNLGNNTNCTLSSINSVYTSDNWQYNDGTAPSAPVAADIASVKAKVGESSSTDYAHLNATTGKIYYNVNATEMTITMTPPSGVVGYNMSGSISDTLSTTLTLNSTLLAQSSVTIYAFDCKGNSSDELELDLAKDETAPTFTMGTVPTSVTSAKAPNGYTVNTYTSGTQLTFTITEDDSGLASYALVYNEGDGNDYSGYTGSPDWKAATGNSITLTLLDTSHYNTNYMLLLKDKVGNVTEPVGSDNSAYSAAAVKNNGTIGWWYSEPVTKSFAAKSKVDGANLEVELTGVNFAVSTIAVTAAGVNGFSGKVQFKDRDGSYKEINGSFSNSNGTGTITISDKYLSYDGTIKFTLTGDANLAQPTEIKLNDTYIASSLISLSLISGFRRFNRGTIRIIDDDEDEVVGPVYEPFTTRNVSFADYFGTAVQPLEVLADAEEPIAFSIGKNMEIQEKKAEKPVIFDEDVGSIVEDSGTENLPLENRAWKAPDGPVSEQDALEGQEIALNMAAETGVSGQMFTARDAGGVQEQKQEWDPALVLALISMLALGGAAVFLRKKTSC